MRKKGSLLLLFLLSLGMLCLICWSVTVQQQSLSLVQFQAQGVELALYRDQENNKYCLFLPSFASQEDLTASHSGMGVVRFSAGDAHYASLSQVPLNRDVTMTVAYPWGAEDRYPLYVSQCSARQTICIETKEGTMALVDESQDNEANVAVAILDSQGQTEYQGYAAISGRGNGTWVWPKKPYDLKFPERITVGEFENLNKLCLLAEYVDESKLRNALAYRAGSLLDIPYASPYAYADVYIDGVYQGIYGLATKQEYTKHTVSHSIETVFELSSSYKGNFFYTDYQKQIRIHHGTQDQVLGHVEAFENALMDRDFDALWQAADLESWARKYALDEFFYNYDLPLTSQYFYVAEDGKVRCMLPWDYEWIFYARMAPYDFNQERALAAYYSAGNWYEILLEDETFREAVAAVLREEFTDSFFTSLQSYMEQCTQELTGSWHCDRYRWNPGYAAAPGEDGGSGTMAYYSGMFREHFDIRRSFLLSLLENWEGHSLLLFFSEKDGNRYQSNLQIIVPTGTEMEAYAGQIVTTLTHLESKAPISITTEDGTPLENVDIIEENLTFTVVY